MTTTSALSGWKTYIVAAGTVIFAGLSYWKGTMDMNAAITYALSAAGLAGFRSALSTSTVAIVEALAARLISALQASANPVVVVNNPPAPPPTTPPAPPSAPTVSKP